MPEIHRLRKVIQWLIFCDVIINDHDLAVKLGYKPTYLSQILNSKTNLSDKFIEGLLSLDRRVSKDWLVKGVGSIFLDYDPVKSMAPGSRIIAPLISKFSYSAYIRNYDNEAYLKVQPFYIAARNYLHGKYVAFEVTCDCMDNKGCNSICSGDIVLGRELERKYWNQQMALNRVYVILHNQRGILIAEIVGIDVPADTISCRYWNPGPEYKENFWLDLGDVLQLLSVRETSRQIN